MRAACMMLPTSLQCERMAAMTTNDEHLIWIDLEMTGLDTDNDSILEIATMVTDKQLNVLAEGPELAIAHPLSRLEAMDEWNRNQHGKSGPVAARARQQGDAGRGRGAARWRSSRTGCRPARSPMCGNSICQDRRFLHRLMPRLEKYFHYRNLDVSTVKELARRWAPEVLAGVAQGVARTPRSATCTTRSPSCATTGSRWGSWAGCRRR